jgi:hypothetical protein
MQELDSARRKSREGEEMEPSPCRGLGSSLQSHTENHYYQFKENRGDSVANRAYFGDKIYSDFDYFNPEKTTFQNIEMLTPVKSIRKEPLEITQRNKAFNDLFSTAVSKIIQPIKSLFNWLNEKTTIQKAMKIRSTRGLLVNMIGKIAIAFIYLIF